MEAPNRGLAQSWQLPWFALFCLIHVPSLAKCLSVDRRRHCWQDDLAWYNYASYWYTLFATCSDGQVSETNLSYHAKPIVHWLSFLPQVPLIWLQFQLALIAYQDKYQKLRRELNRENVGSCVSTGRIILVSSLEVFTPWVFALFSISELEGQCES